MYNVILSVTFELFEILNVRIITHVGCWSVAIPVTGPTLTCYLCYP